MKTFSLIVASVLLGAFAHGQFRVIEPGTLEDQSGGTEDLSGTTIYTGIDNINIVSEEILWVVNETDVTYTSRIIRTEIDVLPGTSNSTAWGLHTLSIDAGEIPVWLVGGNSPVFAEILEPGDTALSFAAYHYAQGLIGCSSYRYDIVNENDQSEILATFDIVFDHSLNGSCATTIEELNKSLTLTIAPNPANDFVSLVLGGVDVVSTVLVTDMLGQEVSSRILSPSTTLERIETSEMNNGVYFLSILIEGHTIRTSKFIVSH